MELSERVRKVDVTKMTPEEVDRLSVQIGSKVRQICDEAANKINAILDIYGMKKAKIAISFGDLEEVKEQVAPAPKKRGRKPKQNNLKEEVKASPKKA
jgi:hypothetical protein